MKKLCMLFLFLPVLAHAQGYAGTGISSSKRGGTCADCVLGGRVVVGYQVPVAAIEGGVQVFADHSQTLTAYDLTGLLHADFPHGMVFARAGYAHASTESGALYGAGIQIGDYISGRLELLVHDFGRHQRIGTIAASIVVPIQ